MKPSDQIPQDSPAAKKAYIEWVEGLNPPFKVSVDPAKGEESKAVIYGRQNGRTPDFIIYEEIGEVDPEILEIIRKKGNRSKFVLKGYTPDESIKLEVSGLYPLHNKSATQAIDEDKENAGLREALIQEGKDRLKNAFGKAAEITEEVFREAAIDHDKLNTSLYTARSYDKMTMHNLEELLAERRQIASKLTKNKRRGSYELDHIRDFERNALKIKLFLGI